MTIDEWWAQPEQQSRLPKDWNEAEFLERTKDWTPGLRNEERLEALAEEDFRRYGMTPV